MYYHTSIPIEQHARQPGKPVEKCYEDNTAYIGNTIVSRSDKIQPSRLKCQQYCQKHENCYYWTYKNTNQEGLCLLKSKKNKIRPNLPGFVSGSKSCVLPESKGRQLI